MTARFKKHAKWIGKDLTLMVGGGDRKIKDTDILEGSQWAKFAGLGFLIQIKDSPEPSAPAPAETASVVATEGTTTKSSASKISMGDEKGKGKGKKEKEEPKKEEPKKEEPKKEEPKVDEVKSDTSSVTTEPSDAPGAPSAPGEGSDYPSDKLTD